MKSIYCYIIVLISIAINKPIAQNAIVLMQDTLRFEEILLDGEVAYREISTHEIISARDMGILKLKNKEGFIEPLVIGNWDTLHVNAYKNEKPLYPFEITFDETRFFPALEGKPVITSRFGRRRRGPHRGIDIDLETGDTVRSIMDGRVRMVGYSSGHGKTIVVRHQNEMETVYAHLSEYYVSTNDFIKAGDILGLGGATGNARGSHLHFEVRYKGICINPEYLIDFHEARFNHDTLYVTKGLTDPLRFSSYSKSEYEILNTRAIAEGYDARSRKVYVVRSGDTLWGIARRNGMRVSDLVNMNKNKVSSKSTLRIGQHLIISP